MGDLALAERANTILRSGGKGLPWVSCASWDPWNLPQVTGTVLYVGCGCDLSSIFKFEEADRYIHQDPLERKVLAGLEVLEQHGILAEVEMADRTLSEREYFFTYKGRRKQLIEISSSADDAKNPFAGHLQLNVPALARKRKLGAVYFHAFPFDNLIKMIQINLLPRLRIGGVFEGSYYSSYFFGAGPGLLGLRRQQGTYVKMRHFESSEIARMVDYSLDECVRDEWERERMKECARKNGIYCGAATAPPPRGSSPSRTARGPHSAARSRGRGSAFP